MPLLGFVTVGAGGGGGGGGAGSAIWRSATAASAFANGVEYIPLGASATSDPLKCSFIAASTGTVELTIRYAMSGSEANGVRLRLDRGTFAAGATPSTALTTGTAFTLTTSADVLEHDLDSGDSADLSFAATAGDRIELALYRLGADGADTHTGDFRVIATLTVLQ